MLDLESYQVLRIKGYLFIVKGLKRYSDSFVIGTE